MALIEGPLLGILFILGIIAFWVVMAVVTYKRWLGYQWIMLLMGIFVALIAGVAYDKSVYDVLVGGANYNAYTIMAYIGACIFARSCAETGIIEAIIKKMIELGAGRPFVTVALVTAAWSYLAQGIPGVAGVIIVGSITLPVMMVMGIAPEIAAQIHLLGTIISWPYWVVYWPVYATYTGLAADKVPLIMPTIQVILAVIFCYAWLVYVFKREKYKFRWSSGGAETPGASAPPTSYIPEAKPRIKMAAWYSFITPAIPVILILGLKWPAFSAFIAGVVPALILTHPGSGRKLTDYFGVIERITYEGFKETAPIGINLIGVGFITYAATLPPVKELFKATLGTIIPIGLISVPALVLLIVLLPMALFRGPGMPFGMGALTAGAFMALAFPSIPLWAWVMAGMWICVGTCPTFAYAVWSYGYVGKSPIVRLTYRRWDPLWTIALSVVSFLILTYLWSIGIVR